MALYRRDPMLVEAIKLVDNLDDSKDNMLIKYYIEHQKSRNGELQKRLEEYQDFFRTLDKFLPNKYPVFR